MFGNDSRAAHFNYVGDSILGSRVNLGAGAKLANTRFDKKEIFGMPHCGAMLGDDVQIGCNAVVDPGVVVGSGVWFAGAHLPSAVDGAHTRETIKKHFH
jgi:bifunctional N-acetylglucosamine-1-phosphate-uridyltransferase/glucosamine-1-phosphate-acetyltransferase GlmU-like protein